MLFLLLLLIVAAVFKVHWAKGSLILTGDEYKLVLYSVVAVLIMLGPGKFSVASKIQR